MKKACQDGEFCLLSLFLLSGHETVCGRIKEVFFVSNVLILFQSEQKCYSAFRCLQISKKVFVYFQQCLF